MVVSRQSPDLCCAVTHNHHLDLRGMMAHHTALLFHVVHGSHRVGRSLGEDNLFGSRPWFACLLLGVSGENWLSFLDRWGSEHH